MNKKIKMGRRKNKRIQSKIEKSIAFLTTLSLIMQVSVLSLFFVSVSPAVAEDLCPTDLDVVLILDRSASMNAESRLIHAKTAANSFVGFMGENDQSALVSFSDEATLDKPLSSNHASTSEAINGLIGDGYTNIGDAIGRASQELGLNGDSHSAKKVQILLTDGKANRPNAPDWVWSEWPADVAYAEEKAQEAADLGYIIYTIGLGEANHINEEMLQNIADVTGGQYFPAPDASDLEIIYNEIALVVCYSSISGTKYNDLNNNGQLNEGEEPIENWEIILSGDADQAIQTDTNGYYEFTGLSNGNYTVAEGDNSSFEEYIQTFPESPYQISLSSGENTTTKDFYNYFPECGNDIIDEGLDEQCDDGNLENSDGCSSTCQIEELTCIDHEDESTCSIEECFWYDESCHEEDQPEMVCGNYQDESSCTESECFWYSDACHADEQEEPQTDIQSGELVINEILSSPNGDANGGNPVHARDGQWFEIYNNTNRSLELQGCTIYDSGSNNHIISQSLPIQGGEYAILAINDDPLKNGRIEPDYVYPSSEFYLDKSPNGDEIFIDCNGQKIDRVEYSNILGFPSSSFLRGKSIILAHPGLDNNVGGNWCVSTSPFGDGYDLGTPSSQNDRCGLGAIISGSKYNDSNKDSNIAGEDKLGNWTILLEKQNGEIWGSFATTTTETNGDYIFKALEAGFYKVREYIEDQTDWIQTYPIEPSYYEFELVENEVASNKDFANYFPACGNDIIDEGLDEQCDDGNLENSDGCSSTCQIEELTCIDHEDESTCSIEECFWYDESCHEEDQPEMVCGNYQDESLCIESELGCFWYGDACHADEQEELEPDPTPPSSGGGGGPAPGLIISQEDSMEETTVSVVITWLTNKLATSRVIYDTVQHEELGDASNYGYAFSTLEYDLDPKVTGHAVMISGLDSDTTYYYRAISAASPEKVGQEFAFVTNLVIDGGTTEEDEPTPEEETGPETEETTGAGEWIGYTGGNTTEETGDESGTTEEEVKEETSEETTEEEATEETKEEKEEVTEEETSRSGFLAGISGLFSSRGFWILLIIILIAIFTLWYSRRKKDD